MGTELTVHQHSIDEIDIMAKQVGRSGLFGMNESQAFTLMCLAQAKGIHPIQAVERYHVISGKPAMKADAMLADFQSAGGTVEWVTMTDTEFAAVFTHPTNAPKGVPVSFTISEAKRAGLTGNKMWEKYPKNMLRARVISNGVRLVMPGIVLGIYPPEEVIDFDDAPVKAIARVADGQTTAEKIRERREQEAAERSARTEKAATEEAVEYRRDKEEAARKAEINEQWNPVNSVKATPWTKDEFNKWIDDTAKEATEWWNAVLEKRGVKTASWPKACREPYSSFRLIGHLCKFLENLVPARSGLNKLSISEKVDALAFEMSAHEEEFMVELENYCKKVVPNEVKAQIDARSAKAEAAVANEPTTDPASGAPNEDGEVWAEGRE